LLPLRHKRGRLLWPGLHRDHVGAGARLRHRSEPDMLPGNQLWQIFRFLRLHCRCGGSVDAEGGMRAYGPAPRPTPATCHLPRCSVEIAEARLPPYPPRPLMPCRPKRADLGRIARKLIACGRFRRRAARFRSATTPAPSRESHPRSRRDRS